MVTAADKKNSILFLYIFTLILISSITFSAEDSCEELNEDSRYNYDVKGSLKLIKNGIEQDPSQWTDTCSGKYNEELVELYCDENGIDAKWDVISCEKYGKTCIDGRCVKDCGHGLVYDIDKEDCFVIDRDGDTIPDDEEEHLCLDTAMGDLVDLRRNSRTFGCSCEQSAEFVMEPTDPYNKIKCQECNTDGHPQRRSHCFDSIKNCGEFSVDCGVNAGCGPCKFPCVPISEEGGLKIGLYPFGYSSNNDVNFPFNYDIWVEKAKQRFEAVTSVAPFDEDKVSFYRIDFFPQIKEENYGLDPLNPWDPLDQIRNYDVFSELTFSCSGLDVIGIDSIGTGRSPYSISFSNKFVLFYDIKERAIVHELGHALCGLKDEYDFKAYDRKEKEISFNCDPNPIKPNIFNRLDEPICIWDPSHGRHQDYLNYMESKGLTPVSFPHAGCIMGCAGTKNYNKLARPKYNYVDTMMIDTMGPFNIIGEEVCRQYVEKYN